MNKKRICLEGVAFFLVFLAGLGYLFSLPQEPTEPFHLHRAGVLLVAAAGTALLCRLDKLNRPRGCRRGLLLWLSLVLAPLLALSNLPWSPLLFGLARVSTTPVALLSFFLFCLATGLFEELFFRAYLFRLFLRRLGDHRRGRFVAVLLSSAIFGLAHLFNLFAGQGIGETLLQVGYSFLVGCACAVLYYATGHLAAAVFFHTLFNFCGLLVPTLGRAERLFDVATVTVMTLLSLALAACLTLLLWQGDEKFFKK